MRLTPAGLSRRDFLAIGGGALAATLLPRDAGASLATGTPLHGISVFGDLKYPPGFAHFDYASPDAPQGGTFNFQPPNWVFNQSVLTFNTLNSFVSKGDAPPRMELCFDSLMEEALDEPDAIYGLVAETVMPTLSWAWAAPAAKARPSATNRVFFSFMVSPPVVMD